METIYGVNRGISYMRRSRVAAIQILFQIEFYESKKTLDEIYKEVFGFYANDYKDVKDDKHSEPLNKELIEKIVPIAIKKQEDTYAVLAPLLKDTWKLEELSFNIKLILRLAIAEIMETKTDLPVIINEYIEITKLFENERDSKFVNSIVETVGRKLREAA